MWSNTWYRHLIITYDGYFVNVLWNSCDSLLAWRVVSLPGTGNSNFYSILGRSIKMGFGSLYQLVLRGRPLMIGRGAEEIKKRTISEALLQKKKLKGLPAGKKIWRGYREEKINSFSNFPPDLPPQIINKQWGILDGWGLQRYWPHRLTAEFHFYQPRIQYTAKRKHYQSMHLPVISSETSMPHIDSRWAFYYLLYPVGECKEC